MARDPDLVLRIDKLGYDEARIGEHRTARYERIGNPELFVATVAERTRSIRLRTGASSPPSHHPLMLADRINQLDHITCRRVMFDVGPGARPSDPFRMGIPVSKQRDRMDEAFGVLVALLRGKQVIKKTDGFELNEARLQMLSYSRPSVQISVASQVSPSGATAARPGGKARGCCRASPDRAASAISEP